MKAYSGSLFLLLLLIFACSARPPEKPAISKAPKLHEYKQHSLGLMDISSDGRFLLMHQKLRDGDPVKRIANHKLRVIEVSSQKEKAAIELQSSEAYMLFRPGSYQVLLNGQLNEPAETGCFLWDIDSGTVRKNETLTQKKLSFAQFVGPDQLVGSVSGDSSNGHYVVYDFRHDSVARLDVTRGERLLFRWDPGLIFSPDFKTLVGQRYSKADSDSQGVGGVVSQNVKWRSQSGIRDDAFIRRRQIPDCRFQFDRHGIAAHENSGKLPERL